MSKTEVSGKQLKDGSVELVDLSPALAGDINTLKSDVATLQTDVAAKADAGNLASVATSGSYNDLADKPSIPSVAGLASETYVDTAVAGKADSASLATVATSGSYTDLTNKPSLFSGDYVDLANKPTIPSVAGLASETYVDTAVAAVVNSAPAVLNTLNELSAALGNDENFATTVAGQIGAVAADVSALDVRATSVEADVAALQNAGVPNLSELNGVAITTPSSGQVLKYTGLGWVNAADDTFSGAYADLTGKPTLFDGAYSSLTGTPSLFSGSYTDLTSKPTLFDGAYSSLTGKPTLATVATSGSYNDLIDKPAAGASDLDGLSDVVITSAAKGHFIAHNGTNFVNTRTLEANAAATTPLSLKGAASQTAPMVEVLNSAGTQTMRINQDGTIRMLQTGNNTYFNVSNSFNESVYSVYNDSTGGWITVGTQIYFTTRFGFNKAQRCFQIVPSQEGLLYSTSNDGGAGVYTFMLSRDTSKACYNFAIGGTGHGWNFATANTSGGLGIDLTGAPEAKLHVNSTIATRKGCIIRGHASQTANLFEAQNSAGTALTTIASDGTVHAARYTETVANAFDSSLAPSTGTLTVDTSTGNAVLGALNAAVTTWAFTNAPADNSKVTTITAVLAGNASYTYGDACSVNGSSVSGGIMWSGGTAPTATAGTDIITFVIVKDSAGTVKVFGSATTNFS